MTRSDDWKVWGWCVAAGLLALGLIIGYRVAGEALTVADEFVNAYERTHTPAVQEIVTDWAVGDSRQLVRTERAASENLEVWLSRHDAGVIGSAESARRRALTDQARTGGGK